MIRFETKVQNMFQGRKMEQNISTLMNGRSGEILVCYPLYLVKFKVRNISNITTFPIKQLTLNFVSLITQYKIVYNLQKRPKRLADKYR